MLDLARHRTHRPRPQPRGSSPTARAAAPADAPEATAPRAPVRRSAVRVLRTLADRLEPAPRCAPQS